MNFIVLFPPFFLTFEDEMEEQTPHKLEGN